MHTTTSRVHSRRMKKVRMIRYPLGFHHHEQQQTIRTVTSIRVSLSNSQAVMSVVHFRNTFPVLTSAQEWRVLYLSFALTLYLPKRPYQLSIVCTLLELQSYSPLITHHPSRLHKINYHAHHKRLRLPPQIFSLAILFLPFFLSFFLSFYPSPLPNHIVNQFPKTVTQAYPYDYSSA